MTAPDDTDQAALDRFFAAARAETEEPRLALLSTILADAAAVQAARTPVPAPPRSRRALAPIGGWRGLAALAACAALGFWLGIAGEVTLDGGTAWNGLDSAESTADQVGAFFDLASTEG